jgi:hypothetical protein
MKSLTMPTSDQEAILRRAIIRAIPEYFVWSETEQERYRLRVPKEQDFLIRQALLRSLFGIEVGTEEGMNEVLNGFNDEQYLLLNSTLLPFQGIGEDDFFLNEWLADAVTLLDFETLGDFARYDHEFQEQARRAEDPAYDIRPYQGDLHPCWARLTDNGEFHYATLVSIARHFSDALDETGVEQIETLIPHKYVEGKNHGKRVQGGMLWDYRVDAGGMEPQLDELRHRYYQYLRDCHARLLDRFDEDAIQRVYIRSKKQGVEPHIEFVFSDKSALDAVRFRRFFSDCRRISGDVTELEVVIEQEQEAAVEYLQAQYSDIQQNFDPSVVPLRKKRRIVLADSALDGLS